MAGQRRTQDTFTGRSGQMAVIAELLIRRCNAAIPEVDVGTDVFAFRDAAEEVARIQVKTAQATRYKKGEGHSAQFGIPIKQLASPDVPPLFYALAVRVEDRYEDFLLISRSQLTSFWKGPCRFGTPDREGNLVLTAQFRERVICGEVDLTVYRNAWALLPPLGTLPPVKEGEQGPESHQPGGEVAEAPGTSVAPTGGTGPSPAEPGPEDSSFPT